MCGTSALSMLSAMPCMADETIRTSKETDERPNIVLIMDATGIMVLRHPILTGWHKREYDIRSFIILDVLVLPVPAC